MLLLDMSRWSWIANLRHVGQLERVGVEQIHPMRNRLTVLGLYRGEVALGAVNLLCHEP